MTAHTFRRTIMIRKTEQSRALNDALRQNLNVGMAFITAGVAALGADTSRATYRGMGPRHSVAVGSRNAHWCGKKRKGPSGGP
jgi:hypothetical protein